MTRRSDHSSTSRALRAYADTTQSPERQIVQFLSEKCTSQALITLDEVAELYNGNLEKAKSVLLGLAADEIIVQVSDDTYRVTV
ncbi:MAG: hypothetical protein AAF458_00545 [Pseudomonadota bacterium]